MNIMSGIKLLDESEGEGKTAEKGDTVIYNMKMFLNKGEEVPLNQIQVRNMPEHLSHMVRSEGDYKFINHHTTLGKRGSMAAVEYSLIG